MDRDAVKGWAGCLIPIIALFAFVVIYRSCNSDKEDACYLVEETGYFHSTNDKDKCRFIKSAKEGNYHINKKSRLWVLAYDKKICKECYTNEEQKTFHEELARAKLLIQKSKEHNKWIGLDSESDCDYDDLTVYIDSMNTIHIDGNCVMILNKSSTKVAFGDIEHINNTCEECVERWLCDFIYKAVYERVYDKSVIKTPEEEYYYDDYEYWPERDR